MLPTFRPGDTLLVKRIFTKYKANDVVVVKDPRDGRLLLKRIKNIQNAKYFVEGDNKQESTDSRTFGWVEKRDIIGNVFYKI